MEGDVVLFLTPSQFIFGASSSRYQSYHLRRRKSRPLRQKWQVRSPTKFTFGDQVLTLVQW